VAHRPQRPTSRCRKHAPVQELSLDARTLNRSTDLIAGAVAQGPLTRRELAAIVERHGIPAAGERITYMLITPSSQR